MNDSNIVSAILADGETAYSVSQPFIDVPNATVQRILLVGNNVEIFAQDNTQGYRKSLVSPMVTTLVALAKKDSLTNILKSMDDREKITKVTASNGDVWALNGSVPRNDSARIVRMTQMDDLVEIVAIPVPGHELDAAGFIVIFTLMPLSFHFVLAEASFSSWIEIQQEMASGDDDGDDGDDDDDDDDEPEEEEVAAAPVAAIPAPRASLIPQAPVAAPPPAPVAVNGAAANPITEG